MASSIASYITLNKDLTTGKNVVMEVPLENCEINVQKQTAVDKLGGILCYICYSTFGNKKDFDSHYGTHNTGEIVYTCVVCKKQHSGYQSFRNHCYIQHVVKDKFVCQQCNKSFSKAAALTAHIAAFHEINCGECSEKFTSKKDLQIHKIVHNKKETGNPPYNCMKCCQVMNSIDMCESHMDDHCDVMYPCPICAMVLPNKQEATLHITEHFDEKITPDMMKPSSTIEDSSIDILGGILCCHCDLLFKNRLDIESHFASEHEDNVIVYCCNICEKQYTKYSLFGNHCHFHVSKDKFQCDQCNRLFPRLPLLVMHNLAFHSEGAVDKPYRCDKCVHGFNSHYRLLEHKRLVHDEVSIKCQIPGCSATFNTPKDLITHQRAHKSCLANWCRKCGLQFATMMACERHLDVHRRKQYACPVCARTYRERYLILKHLPKHFESVLHICKVCGRSYNARNRLIDHVKTHSETKKYKCTYCTKCFCRPHQLDQHERVHTGDKPYRCTVCFKHFASYPNWTKHLTRAHAFDKNMIKQVREAHKQADVAAKSSPAKTESGIESAGSEFSDLYSFIESDDSVEERDGPDMPIKRIKREINMIIQTIDSNENNITKSIKTDQNIYSFEAQSMNDSVNDVINSIDTIDEDLDLVSPVDLHGEMDLNTTTADFTTDFNDAANFNDVIDDSSDIKAIVEHIDALSGGMELPTSQVPTSDMMQFSDLMPVDNVVYNPVPVYTSQVLSEPEYYQPTSVPLEYGPDFNTLGSEVYTDLVNLDEHVLPHIDPLLTIKDEQNAKIFVQNLQNNFYELDAVPVECEQNWQPIISKVFTYDETNDNRMYVLNGNIF